MPTEVRARPMIENQQAFTLSKGHVSTLLMPLAVIGLLTDVPLSQLLILIWHPRHPLWVHGSLLAMALLGMAWLVVDRYAIKSSRHMVGAGRIVLRVGFRWKVEIPVAAIQYCGPVVGRPREWRQQLAITKNQLWSVTPVDPPNILLELDPGHLTGVSMLKKGFAVAVRPHVSVYADAPSAFVEAVRQQVAHWKDHQR